MQSWKGGQNTSIVCSIAHQLSMTTLSIYCHKYSAIFCLMNCQSSQKQGKQHLSSCKLQVQIQFLLKVRNMQRSGTESVRTKKKAHQTIFVIFVYKAGGLPTDVVVECMWRKKVIPQDFKNAAFTNRKEFLKSVTTTEVFISYQLLERYWQKFYRIA